MQRRTAVKQLIVLTAGVWMLPGCEKPASEVTVSLDHLDITPEEESLLAEITETLLPSSDSPGGKQLKISNVVLKMVDDCYGEDEQKEFEKGLSEFNDYAKKNAGDSFKDLGVGDREKLLLDLEKEMSGATDNPQPLHRFYQMTKSLAIRIYLNSESVMTNLTYYKMVPGRFDGCVEIKDPSDFKTIFG